MKKTIVVILSLMFLSSSCLAGSVQDKCKGVIEKKRGASSCSTATNEIGNRSAGTVDTYAYTASSIYCQAYTPDCSGNTAAAYLYHRGTSAARARVGIYNKSGSSPVVGDTKIAEANAILTSSTDKEWATATFPSTAVSSTTAVWLCIVPGDTNGSNWDAYVANGTSNRYSQAIGATTLPANLGGTWTGPTADRMASVYITVGP